MPRLWIDVEDLFHYAATSPRPSGIQRLSFEIQQALVARFGPGGSVRFVRHDPLRGGFAEVTWDDVATLFHGMVARPTAARPAAPLHPRSPDAHGWPRRLARRIAHRLPLRVREPLTAAARLQIQSWRSLLQALRATLRRPAARQEALPAEGSASSFIEQVAPGDILVVLGSPWWHLGYADFVAQARRRHGLRFALLTYDLIPLRHPEWCDRNLVAAFRAWFGRMLPLCDAVMAISRATARDVERHAAESGLALPGPVQTIPIGTGFSAHEPAAADAPRRDLPPPGSYALFVSTIEARKNHALLLRVWRRLLAELPADQVPTLVFAGRVGWLVADMMQQLANTNYLGGRVVVVEDPSDAELEALYRGCLFTLFPSLYEGWGLPVTESLAFGKPCIVANTTSLPEAGGALARYLDPEDVNDAHRVIRETILDRAGLAEWTARVRREFRPVSWDASAEAVVRALAPELLEQPR